MVFHKQPSVTDHFFDKRKEVMNTIIELNTPRMIFSARGLQPGRMATLVAPWQSGPETLGGYEQRKLRLVFARFPLNAKQPDA
jgi:hypothetical protein